MLIAYAILCPTAQLITDKQSKRTKSRVVQYLRSKKNASKESKENISGVTSIGVTLLMEMKEQNSKLTEGNGFWSHNYGLYTTDKDEVARFKTIAHHTKPGICTSFQFAIYILKALK